MRHLSSAKLSWGLCLGVLCKRLLLDLMIGDPGKFFEAPKEPCTFRLIS